MITIMKTKTFLNAIDDAYAKGAAAGANAEALKDKEDQNHRLEDMLKQGKKLGYKEGYEAGYHAGYMDGDADSRIDIQGIEEVDNETFESV